MKINDVILCDDIRQEANGKSLLIGVYGGTVGFRQAPVSFNCCFCLLGRIDESDAPFDVRVSLEPVGGTEEKEIFKHAFPPPKSTDERFQQATVNLTGVTIPIEQDSVLSVHARPHKGRWREINRWYIDVRPAPAD